MMVFWSIEYISAHGCGEKCEHVRFCSTREIIYLINIYIYMLYIVSYYTIKIEQYLDSNARCGNQIIDFT